jgi:predicted Zn finger-like uncharacterized protein
MKITCDSCQSKYNVSDEKVQGKTVKIRCKKCGATLIVNGAGAAAHAGGGAPSNGAGDVSYTVNVADGDQRTMTMTELVAAYNERVIDQETFVWADGMADWMPLGQVESIVEALNAPSAHEQAAAPAYEPPQPAYEPPPAAYAAPAAEERRAAVVKREGSRGTRDLFGGGAGAGMEEVANAPAFDGSGSMPPMAAPAGATGQRNENSVLFSLSALTRTETPAPAAVSMGGAARKEDSGLIDLKALTDSAAAVGSPRHDDAPAPLFPSAVASPFGSPLGSFDAPAVPLGSIAPPAQKKNMAVILVIAATVVALAGIIAVAVVVKSGRDRDIAAAAAASASAAAIPTTPATTAEPVASVAPRDPTPSASTSAVAAGTAKKPPPGGVKPPPGGVVQPPKPPPGPGDPPKPPPPKPPAGGDCGCNGDLMCLMGCRAKK